MIKPILIPTRDTSAIGLIQETNSLHAISSEDPSDLLDNLALGNLHHIILIDTEQEIAEGDLILLNVANKIVHFEASRHNPKSVSKIIAIS